MIRQQSKCLVADNSGVKLAFCISQGDCTIGDEIVISCRKVSPKSTFKKGDISRAVIVRTRKEIRRPDGTTIKFEDNAVVLIKDKEKEPKGTAIFGPIPREIKKKYPKIVSLALDVV